MYHFQKSRQYYPKESQTGDYYWQSAYIDGPANHYTLPSYLYQLLGCCGTEDKSYLRKYYPTYERAIDAIKYAFYILDLANEYRNIKETE